AKGSKKGRPCWGGCGPNVFHHLFKCPIFTGLSAKDRAEFVEKNNICFICLIKGHDENACYKAQDQRYACRVCKKQHDTLLHGTVIRGVALVTTLAVRTCASDSDCTGGSSGANSGTQNNCAGLVAGAEKMIMHLQSAETKNGPGC
ncbi:hypothetical protein DC007_14450, partial [Enterococcus faecalis]